MGYSFMMPIICTQLFLVTISLVILTNNNQSMILSVADGYSYRPFHIIFNQAFNCQLYMRELIVISVKTKSGNFSGACVFVRCPVCFSLCFVLSFFFLHLSSKQK